MNTRNLLVVFVALVWASTAKSTLQIPATATFDGAEYTIIDVVGKLPSPTDFDIDAVSEATGLSGHVAGYVLEFLIDAERTFLNGMYVLSLSGEYPPINGVRADVKCFGANGVTSCNPGEYSNLKLRLEFDGRLRIAKDFIKSCYDHLDAEPQMFRVVKDLTFENGQLVNVLDRSDEASAIQRQFKDPSECRKGLSFTMSPL